jgi:transposase-like protein
MARALLDYSGRWTPLRKAAVLKEIAAGELSVAEACRRWELSLEELQSWRRDYQRWGVRGLKTTGAARRGRYRILPTRLPQP